MFKFSPVSWIASLCLIFSSSADAYTIKSFPIKKPAFISVHFNQFTSERELLISSFFMFGHKAIYRMPFWGVI